MALETRPQVGRPVISAREAARQLRLDPRTVKKRIESGDLAGGVHRGPKQPRWYVYADQILTHADADSGELGQLRTEVAHLHADRADLQAQLLAAQETTRLLLASQAQMREALQNYQLSAAEITSAASGFRDAADGYRTAAQGFERATSQLQTSNACLNEVLDNYGDALSQHSLPGHLGTLPPPARP